MSLIKEYLPIFSILFLVVFFQSCFPYDNGGACPKANQCESNNQCIEEFGENFICFNENENYKNNNLKSNSLIELEVNYLSCAVPETYCIEDTCKSKNIDCGEGECSLRGNYGSGFAVCICNENANYTKMTSLESYEARQCLIDITCETSKDCNEVNLKNGNYAHICSPTGKCVSRCSKDSDCKGKNEICNANGDKCLDLSARI